MIKPDWNVFKSKFSENPQNNFEWMCYLLFCNEHGKHTGIFRYKNQSAIETEPLTINEEVIGWQAKFYDTALSEHKNDILEMLQKAKRDYPNISKIYFYTNTEWGQNKGKEPKGKTEIDDKAKELDIDLEWRCTSYFESPFVVTENKNVVSHFFKDSYSIYDLLTSLTTHTEKVLDDIETEINFSGLQVTIDRSEILSDIRNAADQAIILSGDGGTGKTALIKSLYQGKDPDSAFYVHKATEFSINNIEQLLSGFSLNNFIEAHQGVSTKIIIIDSAENLLGLENIDPFREYISTLLKSGWKIWMTTRNNYLDDLTFQFVEVYKIAYKFINLTTLTDDHLNELSIEYQFQLPYDQKLRNLITIPFYLKEYLKHYQENKSLNYTEFKNALWPRIVTKRLPQREQAFIELAVIRANSSHFFVSTDAGSADIQAKKSLNDDGVISYESPHGYFITHDIYEEWALEKYIESKFLISVNAIDLFSEIKQSLPIRRAFRKWLSEKLGEEDQNIISFIQDSLSSEIPNLWTDEVLISILLSNYSDFFFSAYKNRLLENGCSLLKQICLLIRIGCKEVDHILLERIGQSGLNILSMDYIFTKPKGNGWKSLIKFIYENLSLLGERKFSFILPIIYDWNSSNRTGETTKYSSLLALKYHEWIIKEDIYLREDETSNKLILSALYGVQEISEELSQLIDQITANQWNDHNDPYYLLSQYILSKPECFSVTYKLPEKVIELAKLFWTYEPPKSDDYFGQASHDIDNRFGIERHSGIYYPSSGFQTPIYSLLQTNLKLALDFIIEFTNFATEKYANSSLVQDGIETVTVTLNNGVTINQYISNRLWCIYRGTQVNPEVLESIHMSLERFLLEQGNISTAKNLETILYYIISQTNSASLSSIVASVVTAFPEKTFQVAQILFRTKEFFLYDTSRFTLDLTHKNQLTMLQTNFGIDRLNKLHTDERIKACDMQHRRSNLEQTMFRYQIFRDKETTDEAAQTRLDEIWKILDNYYDKLPINEDESSADITWRLYLARMDRRKMTPVFNETKNGTMIEFKPEIDSKLSEYSEQAQEESNELFKHSELSVWSYKRLYNRENYQNYVKYESNPLVALEESRLIWSDILTGQVSASTGMYRSLPSDVCALLLRDFPEKMDTADFEFCKEVILDYGSKFLQNGYSYQTSDGVVPALFSLPKLLEYFPEEKEKIKILMILALMREDSINMGGTKFNSVITDSMQSLWNKDFQCALSIYIGYLILAHKKKIMLKEYQQSARKKGIYTNDMEDFWNAFFESSSEIIENIVDESINHHVIEEINIIDIDILATAFQIIPLKTDCVQEIPYIEEIILLISKKLLSADRVEKIEYLIRHPFLEKYTKYVLHLEINEIQIYLAPFTDNFTVVEGLAELLKEFISAEDKFNRPEQFWIVWEQFKDKIIATAYSNRNLYDADKVIKSYMFASNQWKDDAKKWHTFTEIRKTFFSELSIKMGWNPTYVYSLSKLICGIGSIYLEDGIFSISSAINSNKFELLKDNKDDTIFYIEKAIRRYMFINKTMIKRTSKTKFAVITILDFLVNNGSIIGYLLREDIA